MWNQFFFPFFKADVGIEQGSALSPILSALYIMLILYIFEKRSKTPLFPIKTLILSFVGSLYFLE